MKIFTDSTKWDDKWFRGLAPSTKLIYLYLCDRSDHAGVWEFDPDLLRLHLNLKEEHYSDDDIEGKLDALCAKVEKLPNGKYWITNYISFQNPKGINRNYNHCMPIYRSLEKNGIDPEQFQQSVMDLGCEGESDPTEDIECTTVMELWNSRLKSLPKIQKMTPARKRKIKSAIKDKTSFTDLFDKVAESDYLMGKVKRWNATFDWVLKPENRQKIMEGNYGSTNRKATSTERHAEGF